MPKTIVVLNKGAGSGHGGERETELTNLFLSHGVEIGIVFLGEGADVGALLAQAGAAPDATVVAGGGDGTISAVAAELAGTGRTLGVLPLGTLNHFAKDLGIPLDLPGAVETAARGSVRGVDVGEVNGRVFVNNSGLGLYPRIVSKREEEQKSKGTGKWPAFARATVDAFRYYPFLHLRIHLDGEERALKTAFIFVGNNEYEVAGLSFGGRACLNSGKLGFYLANRTGRLGILRLACRALFGRVDEAPDFERFCVDEIRIQSGKRSLLVATDGEVTRMRTPLHYRIRPGALRVLVPAGKGEP